MDGVQSDFCNLTCGIPQNSILFWDLCYFNSIYINDLPSCNCFANRKCMQMILLLPRLRRTYVSMNCDMKSVQSQLIANKLTFESQENKVHAQRE